MDFKTKEEAIKWLVGKKWINESRDSVRNKLVCLGINLHNYSNTAPFLVCSPIDGEVYGITIKEWRRYDKFDIISSDKILNIHITEDSCEFQDGDIISVNNGDNFFICILKSFNPYENELKSYSILIISGAYKSGLFLDELVYLKKPDFNSIKKANKEEIELLNSALESRLLMWDSDAKSVVRWFPKEGEYYKFIGKHDNKMVEVSAKFHDEYKIGLDSDNIFPHCYDLSDKIERINKITAERETI